LRIPDRDVDDPVVGTVGDDRLEEVTGQRAELLLPQPRQQGVVDEPGDLVLPDPLQGPAGQRRDLADDPFGVPGLLDPGGDATSDLRLQVPLPDRGAGEEVVGDELLEAAGQAGLAPRDDRGVRDRQPEGCRNRAVTANQSAMAPTMPASAAALT